MKFCCENFQWRYSTSDGMGLNIRVAKMHNTSSNRGFFITEGFQQGSTNVKNVKIDYCPFCGIKLSLYYKNFSTMENSVVEDFLG